MYGEPQKPTHFLCLVCKMLQIQPDKDIVVEFIKNDDFKYLRLLGGLVASEITRAEMWCWVRHAVLERPASSLHM